MERCRATAFGAPASHGQALLHELETLREFPAVAELLAGAGLSQERRALRCVVRGVTELGLPELDSDDD